MVDDDDHTQMWVEQYGTGSTVCLPGETVTVAAGGDKEITGGTAKRWRIIPEGSTIRVGKGAVLTIDCEVLCLGRIYVDSGTLVITDQGRLLSLCQKTSETVELDERNPNGAGTAKAEVTYPAFKLKNGGVLIQEGGLMALQLRVRYRTVYGGVQTYYVDLLDAMLRWNLEQGFLEEATAYTGRWPLCRPMLTLRLNRMVKQLPVELTWAELPEKEKPQKPPKKQRGKKRAKKSEPPEENA